MRGDQAVLELSKDHKVTYGDGYFHLESDGNKLKWVHQDGEVSKISGWKILIEHMHHNWRIVPKSGYEEIREIADSMEHHGSCPYYRISQICKKNME